MKAERQGPHKFRWQPAQRHTWCECGRWEGFLGHYPERKEHKGYWEEHVKKAKESASPDEASQDTRPCCGADTLVPHFDNCDEKE